MKLTIHEKLFVDCTYCSYDHMKRIASQRHYRNDPICLAAHAMIEAIHMELKEMRRDKRRYDRKG